MVTPTDPPQRAGRCRGALAATYAQLLAGRGDAERAGLALLAGAWLARTGLELPPLWQDLLPGVDAPEPASGVAPDLGAVVEALASLGTPGGRRRCGVFYTPDWLVTQTLDVALDSAPSDLRLLDPACGAGSFLVAAVRHGVAPGSLLGVDSDPWAVLAARLALVELGCSPDAAARQIACRDALLEPPAVVADAVVGNPPWGLRFTRDQRALVAPDERGEVCSAALFLRAAARWVTPGGRIAFVLPESWLSTRRAEPLRRWLLAELRLTHLDVLRKGVFTAAPDMVPVVAVLRCEPPAGLVRVRWHGLRRALAPGTWEREALVDPSVWRAEPLAAFAVGDDPRLAGLWARLRRSCGRLDEWVAIHDGVYKTRLAPLLGAGGAAPLLSVARQLTRFGLPPPESLPRIDLGRLPAAEQARQTRPKLLLHALRKPALPDRLVAAVDTDGRYVASNNFLLLLPRPGCPCSLDALCALLNSRLLNAWYAARFIQVNIEAFTVGALPVPSWSATADRALAGASDDEREGLVARLYALTAAEQAALDERWKV